MKVFKGLTTIKKHSDGRYSVECPLKLWRAEGNNRDEVFHEARHYFNQYLDEYTGEVINLKDLGMTDKEAFNFMQNLRTLNIGK